MRSETDREKVIAAIGGPRLIGPDFLGCHATIKFSRIVDIQTWTACSDCSIPTVSEGAGVKAIALG